MRSLIIPASIAAFLAVTPLALAADTTTGTVKAVDLKALTLTLDNGTTFSLPAGFKDPGLTVGSKVQVTSETKNKQHIASKVTIEK